MRVTAPGRPVPTGSPSSVTTGVSRFTFSPSSKADVRSSETATSWTTVYEDEFDLLDLHTNAAEFYFEVQVEDQVCTSGEIHVY